MKIFYIQPILTNYRASIVESLTRNSNDKVWVLSDRINPNTGFSNGEAPKAICIETKIFGFMNNKIFYQSNIIKNIVNIRPASVISFANPRYISFWTSLIVCKFLGIKYYSHGQGLYAHPKPTLLQKFLYKTLIKLSTKYLCYTKTCEKSMLNIGIKSEKLITVENTLELESVVYESEKNYTESGILFIGRLRENCKLENLIFAIIKCRITHPDMILHVIGDGENSLSYKKKFANYNWIIWHGAIYNQHKISQISKMCRIGCYPGDAGLSVVHMFGLSLPPLIHGSMCEHMGPEPSYIIDKNNGFLFDKMSSGKNALDTRLLDIWNTDQSSLRTIGRNAFECYRALNTPSLGEKFRTIITAP